MQGRLVKNEPIEKSNEGRLQIIEICSQRSNLRLFYYWVQQYFFWQEVQLEVREQHLLTIVRIIPHRWKCMISE